MRCNILDKTGLTPQEKIVRLKLELASLELVGMEEVYPDCHLFRFSKFSVFRGGKR
jgi:hypothetical protein